MTLSNSAAVCTLDAVAAMRSFQTSHSTTLMGARIFFEPHTRPSQSQTLQNPIYSGFPRSCVDDEFHAELDDAQEWMPLPGEGAN
jgi:hypothetical protein